jgi:hypothetical protein
MDKLPYVIDSNPSRARHRLIKISAQALWWEERRKQ